MGKFVVLKQTSYTKDLYLKPLNAWLWTLQENVLKSSVNPLTTNDDFGRILSVGVICEDTFVLAKRVK